MVCVNSENMVLSYSLILAFILVAVSQISAIPIPHAKNPQIPNTKAAEKQSAPPAPVQVKITPEEKELTELTKTDVKTLSRVPKVKSTQTEGKITKQENSKATEIAQPTQEQETVGEKKPDKKKDVDSKIQGKQTIGTLPNLDLSPSAVAEYLIITGDFKGFETAVSDLVNSGVMTADEAVLYKDRVGLELESLLQEAQNELLEEKVEEELDTPQAAWPSYNWPSYETPVQEFPGYEAPRPRRNMADDTRDQLILAELIDRVVAEYAQAQEKAAYNERLRENNAQAQAMLDMILNNQQSANEEPVYGRIVENPLSAETAANPAESADEATGAQAASQKTKPEAPEKSAQSETPAVPPQPTSNKAVVTSKPTSSDKKLVGKNN